MQQLKDRESMENLMITKDSVVHLKTSIKEKRIASDNRVTFLFQGRGTSWSDAFKAFGHCGKFEDISKYLERMRQRIGSY